jgi:hypothetical protein
MDAGGRAMHGAIAEVGADGGFFPLHEQQRADVGSRMLFSDRLFQG